MKVKRSYEQFCALARALDVVGERWTLLIVRELLPGPRRYRDLLRDLPGIGTNLLAARLRALEADGVVERLPTGGYELTAHGRELAPALVALARWGMRDIAPPTAADAIRPGWYALAMQASAAGGLPGTYVFDIDGEVFHLRDGEPVRGPATDPDLMVTTDARTLLALLTGTRTPGAARRAGDAILDGSPAALERWLAACRLPVPGTSTNPTA